MSRQPKKLLQDLTEHKRAGKKLKYDQNLYRELLENVNDLVQSVGPDGKLIYVNRKWRESLGYSEEEAKNMFFKEILREDQIDHCNKIFQGLLRGKTYDNVETVFKTKNGKDVPVECNLNPVMQKGEVVETIGIFRDITERKKMEDALVQERDLMQALIDNIPDHIYFKDEKNRFIRVNKTKAEFSSTTPENMIGKTDFDFFPQGQAKEMSADDNWVMESDRALVDRVEKITDGDGSQHWVSVTKIPRHNERGEVIGTMGISRDITGRKKKEQEIKRRAEEWSRTFDAVADFISVHDKDFRLISVNKSLADALKVKPENLIGKRCYETLHKSDKPWPSCPLVEVLKDGKTHTAEVEDPNVGLPLLITASPIFDQKGELIGGVHVAKDITERKKIEQMKDDFVSLASHELRTPLTSIAGYVDLILDGDVGEINKEQKEFLEIISQNTQRLEALINDVLDIEKIESGRIKMKREKVNLSEIVEASVNTFKVMAEGKGLKLEKEIKAAQIEVLGDSDRLSQVFSNLLSNAIKYTKEGKVKVTAQTKGKFASVTVEDTGVGMSQDELRSVFTRFFRAEDSYVRKTTGTGLGLSIAKATVERHNGDIRGESKLGAGSKFEVILPLLKEPKKVD